MIAILWVIQLVKHCGKKELGGAEFVAANDLLDIFASALIGDNLKVMKFSA